MAFKMSEEETRKVFTSKLRNKFVLVVGHDEQGDEIYLEGQVIKIDGDKLYIQKAGNETEYYFYLEQFEPRHFDENKPPEPDLTLHVWVTTEQMEF